MEDSRIIDLYNERDEQALVYTKERYSDYCRYITGIILGNSEDAEEALNDTWLAAWNAIPPHIPKCLRTFLGRLTRNISLKRIRSDKAAKRGGNEVRVIFDEIEEWLRSSQDVEREISHKELVGVINAFLESVSDDDRRVFVSRYWYMKPVSDIAREYSFSESKVKSKLFRMRKKLYERLEQEGFI